MQDCRDCKVDQCHHLRATPDNRSYTRSRYGRAVVETLALGCRVATLAFVPFISSPVTRTVFGAGTAVECKFVQLCF